jgi:RNA polymerase sigma factor (sigma-70 family)
MATQTHLTTVHVAADCNNAALLQRAANDDQSAWKELIDKYDRFVRSVAGSCGLQAADVDDVAQTTWLRLVQNLHRIRDPERLAGWLAVTASRESLAVLRKASRTSLVPMVNETADPEVDLEASAVARDLWATVGQLPPRQQRLLIALFQEELDSYDDVATKCLMPIGSIGPTRARALSHLRQRLAERGLRPADL